MADSILFEIVAAVAGVPGGVAGQEAEDKQADEEDDNEIDSDFKGQHGTAPKGLYLGGGPQSIGDRIETDIAKGSIQTVARSRELRT